MATNTPFLILGAGRGGTSLLAALLDAHSAVDVAFEFGAGTILHRAALGAYRERLALLRAACDERAAESPARLWGNKITTGQVAWLYPEPPTSFDLDHPADPVLRELFQHSFGGSKVIFIIRDGTSCIDSKIRRDSLSLDESADRWLYSIQMYRYLEDEHPDTLLVRFEDLVMSPAREMSRVCSHLGIDFQVSMLAGTNNPKMRPEYQQQSINPDTIRRVVMPDHIVTRIRPAMTRMGYVLDNDSAPIRRPASSDQ